MAPDEATNEFDLRSPTDELFKVFMEALKDNSNSSTLHLIDYIIEFIFLDEALISMFQPDY